MTRRDELKDLAKSLVLKINEIQPGQWDSTDQRDCDAITAALLQVEREVWDRVVEQIETELAKENESTDDQIWEIRDWCKQQKETL